MIISMANKTGTYSNQTDATYVIVMLSSISMAFRKRCVSVFVLCSSRISSIGRSWRCERGMCTFARSACIQLLLMSPSTKLFCNVEFSSLQAKFRHWTIRNRWCKRTRLLITAYVHGRQSKCLFAILASAYVHAGDRERESDTEKKEYLYELVCFSWVSVEYPFVCFLLLLPVACYFGVA